MLTELSLVITLRSDGLLGYFTHSKKCETFFRTKEPLWIFDGSLFFLSSSSTKSESKWTKAYSCFCLKVDEYEPKQRLQNEFFISPNCVSITLPI